MPSPQEQIDADTAALLRRFPDRSDVVSGYLEAAQWLIQVRLRRQMEEKPSTPEAA